MTPLQKIKITEMRVRGESYGQISAELNISKSTVKSFCRRNLSAKSENLIPTCPQCGGTLTHIPHKRQKRFCSNACRMAWWNAHPEMVNRQANYDFTCKQCGKPFTAYGNNRRQYCSRACFGVSQSRNVRCEATP